MTLWAKFAAGGEIKGEVTLAMNGLYSTGECLEKRGEKISEAILSNITKMVAKQS